MDGRCCRGSFHLGELDRAFPTLVCSRTSLTSGDGQVRIYAVKDEDILGRDHKAANAFAGGKKKKRSKAVAPQKKRS